MNWKLLSQIMFWIAYMTAFWGSFEIAFQATEAGLIKSPVWSGTFGPPVLHHYLIGFLIVAIAWIVLSKEDLKKTYKLLRR